MSAATYGSYEVSTHLAADDRALLERVAAHLPLLADLTHADVALFARAGSDVVSVAEGQPATVPSLYAQAPSSAVVTRAEAPRVFRVLVDGARNVAEPTVMRGAPVLLEVFGIRNARGEVVGALRSEIALIEHERLRRGHSAYRRAVARARNLILQGRMQGGERLGRFGMHDGAMVLDSDGRIEYMSAVAEHLYRRLGYADNLVNTQLQELETNEYVCFKAIERGICLEQRVQEQDLVWIKRAIPLPSAAPRGWQRWPRPPLSTGGAIVVIQDVTDALHKERELKVKTAMIQEIHHRVKNNLQTVAALLRLQARRAERTDLRESLGESVGRILSVAVVHEFLSREESSAINIHEVGNRVLAEIRNGVLDESRPLTLRLEGPRHFTLPAQHATSCALILNELVQNAVRHAFAPQAAGTIIVRLRVQHDSFVMEIEDNGRGLPPGFDCEKDGGLGLQIVRSLVAEDLKGDFALENGLGTTATVTFPKWIARSE